MKRIIPFLLFAFLFAGCDELKQIQTSTGGGGVTQAEAGQGIKEALSQGLVKSVLQLNKQDGFFGDAFYKILLPPDAKKIENTLRDLGMNKIVDKAILQINRGAEDAVGYATPIFTDAIKQMTITDAINIVRGGDTSVTHYFRTKTNERLVAAFSPVIKSSLDKVEATKYYGDIVKTYNSFPTTFNKVNPDLPGFVTEKATNALFDLISKEEKKYQAKSFGKNNRDIEESVWRNILNVCQ